MVIIGGLAELVSGSISMGLGAYLAAVTERDHYDAELKREWQEVQERPLKKLKKSMKSLPTMAYQERRQNLW